jgi:hypothetical protein
VRGRKTTMDYMRMLYISYGSVCELETQIILAGDLDLIEKGESGTLNKGIAEIESNVEIADKVFGKQNPESFEPFSQINRRGPKFE